MKVNDCVCGGKPYWIIPGYDPVHYEYEILSGESEFEYPDPMLGLSCEHCGRSVRGEYVRDVLQAWEDSGSKEGEIFYVDTDTCPYDLMDCPPSAKRYEEQAGQILEEADIMLEAEGSAARYVQWRVLDTTVRCVLRALISDSTPQVGENESSVLRINICKVVIEYLRARESGADVSKTECEARLCKVIAEGLDS